MGMNEQQATMNPHDFHIVYDGDALKGNTFDVRELAPALLAFGDMLEHANRVLNDDKIQVSVRVNASFKTGCFGIDFSLVQTGVQQIIDMFTTKEVAALATILGLLGLNGKDGLLWLIKKLKGRKIRSIEPLNASHTRIYLDDDHVDIEHVIVEMLADVALREAIEKAVYKPLQAEGIDSFSVTDGKDITFDIHGAEADYFVSPPQEDLIINSNTIELSLSPISLSFKENNVWKFTDGSATYAIRMTDSDLLRRIENNEISFSKGDVFRLKLATTTWQTQAGIKTEYNLLEILSYTKGAKQLKLVD